MINEIILHCSATKEGVPFNAADINKWHIKRGFKKIGYNYVILLDGTVEKGREEGTIGAHTIGHNAHSIGICYIGGLDDNGKAKDTRTEEQKKALLKLVHSLLKKYDLTIKDVHGHYEFANKACPCFKITTFKDEYNEQYNN